ncbi:DUF3618 domain-containing protein [Tianweitania populi]|uniref:DUF3618 domain-containing protein n=1 Tax=Tianweitania populi TaxID=1607949 RepID=A0A8J3DX00_9HYPH|nr:DUF3618 domain-containing protein [Tianweitania populi]GHD15100.1 hypothetical protein GCM10016234_21400 [Tianweitania populi]
MSESTSSLEREAEETRARIADTAETLRAKMTPGQMVDEFTSIFRGGDTQTALVNLKNQVRDNPLPLALVGAGLAWLAIGKGTSVSTSSFRDYDRDELRDYPARSYPAAGYESDDRDFGDTYGDQDYSRSTYGASGSTYRGSGSSDYEPGTSGSDNGPGVIERATGAASDAWDSATGAVSDAAGAIGDKLSGVGSSAQQAGSRAARGAADYGSRAARGAADYGSRTARGTARRAQGLADSASDLFNREPLATAAVGLAIGALIGTLLPRTQTEDEQLGKYSDNLKEQAKNLASEGLDHAKEVATETYAAAKSEAEKQGLNPAGVEVGDLHLADRVSSVIKSAARAGEEAARDKLGSASSDEDKSSDDNQGFEGSKPTQGSSQF